MTRSRRTAAATRTETLSTTGADGRLDAQEEQTLRMSRGRTLVREAELETKAPEGSETLARLQQMEAEIFLKLLERSGELDGPEPTESRTKSKIVRALRKKL